ncbi:hypothetical protein I3760_01G085900 [Carya illinoinensis]|nr:hypothetical protein I3760_01G085900 [Carya illinoinensis]
MASASTTSSASARDSRVQAAIGTSNMERTAAFFSVEAETTLLFSTRAGRPNSLLLFFFTYLGDFDLPSDPKDSSIVPLFGNHTLSKDAAMGLVLSAVSVRGWTTGSGMEGPSIPAEAKDPMFEDPEETALGINHKIPLPAATTKDLLT